MKVKIADISNWARKAFPDEVHDENLSCDFDHQETLP